MSGRPAAWKPNSRSSSAIEPGWIRNASYLEAVSVLVENGRRVETLRSEASAVFIVDLSLTGTGAGLRFVEQQLISN